MQMPDLCGQVHSRAVRGQRVEDERAANGKSSATELNGYIQVTDRTVDRGRRDNATSIAAGIPEAPAGRIHKEAVVQSEFRRGSATTHRECHPLRA